MTLLREPMMRAMMAPPVSLRGVGPGFVERIDAGEIFFDHSVAEFLENDPRQDGEVFRLATTQVSDEDGRSDDVGLAAEQAQEAGGFGAIGRFADDAADRAPPGYRRPERPRRDELVRQ